MPVSPDIIASVLGVGMYGVGEAVLAYGDGAVEPEPDCTVLGAG